MIEPLSVLLLATIMDLILGDPEITIHPVRIVGKFITKAEDLIRSSHLLNMRLNGVLLLMLTTCLFTGATWTLSHILWSWSHIAGTIFSAICLYFTIGMKCLADEALSVYEALRKKDLAIAQARLSRIVGRDTAVLDEVGIARATIETVAENLVDAIIGPIFYWLLFGAPGAVFYRVVNTLDAMVGYKNERYREFGWASARMDDLLNLVPARVTPFAIFIATLLLKKRLHGKGRIGSIFNYVKLALRQGQGHESPNSAISEAAFAQSLSISLGGPTRYSYGLQDRPFLNEKAPPPSKDHIILSIRLMYTTILMVVTSIWLIGMLKNFL